MTGKSTPMVVDYSVRLKDDPSPPELVSELLLADKPPQLTSKLATRFNKQTLRK